MKQLWYPPQSLINNSNVKNFIDRYGIKHYTDLIKRSTEDIEWFWSAAAKELKIDWFKPYTEVLDISEGIQFARWFTGGKLNIVHNALDRHAISHNRKKIAFTWVGEDGSTEKNTYQDLYIKVNKLANALKDFGVEKGDTIALLLPMLPETVISLYAILKVGAIVVPIFSGFGSSAIATRLEDSKTKIIVTADGTQRRGKIIGLKGAVDRAANAAKTVEKIIVHKRLGIEVPWSVGRDFWWDDVCNDQPSECPAEPVDSEHPALLLYTSGTTGRPKGAIISHVGALLQSSKEIYFNLDLKPEDTFMWITDIGWMMGPWQLIGVQHLSGSHMLFEGAIDYPEPDRMWRIIEEFGITHLGGSATVFRMLKSFGDELVKTYDLTSLRIIGNTGEPIDPDTWFWLLKTVGQEKCPIINLSGGTEIFGCFILPLPLWVVPV
jgi:acetyl-CoA synthetase